MAKSKSTGKKKARRPHDGPHWGVASVAGYQRNGSDTAWYLVYGKTLRREEVGRGESAMLKASKEAQRRNEAARARHR